MEMRKYKNLCLEGSFSAVSKPILQVNVHFAELFKDNLEDLRTFAALQILQNVKCCIFFEHSVIYFPDFGKTLLKFQKKSERERHFAKSGRTK